MRKFKQGEVIYVDLNPTKGVETNKKRPCVVVSNNNYNHYFNTVIVAPISSSEKYLQPKFTESPLFIQIPKNEKVKGTILMQQLRSIDPAARTNSTSLFLLDTKSIEKMRKAAQNFF